MKNFLILGLFLTIALVNVAHANPEMARAKNCMSCHATANKILGPSFKDVAAKYAGQAGAEDKLVQKVMKGSAGVWGPIPMPANPQLNEADARTIVKWILTVK